MTEAGQFIYGWFEDEGLRLLEAGNIDKMLGEKNLSTLFLLGRDQLEDGSYINKFEREQVVAYSHLTTDYDDNGRKVRRNHTFLFHYDDVFREFLKTVEPRFVDSSDKLPAFPLKPLEVNP